MCLEDAVWCFSLNTSFFSVLVFHGQDQQGLHYEFAFTYFQFANALQYG